ncbi:hypothetical protein GCM10010995_09950 [Cysteiniphilum litorale]|uniref:Uncharacterized protein n=1 Tax=Cysteiniphilum litorale TaxID=2056700 RepID=A0A8J2Z3R7_9GAMM|nr:hypothetical protein GCM10010995_09950 [Cysteiniphilum litorale]
MKTVTTHTQAMTVVFWADRGVIAQSVKTQWQYDGIVARLHGDALENRQQAS